MLTLGSLEGLQEDYRSAFHLYERTVDRLLLLRQREPSDSLDLHAAEARAREAQDAFRDARDKLALVLLERRGRKLARQKPIGSALGSRAMF